MRKCGDRVQRLADGEGTDALLAEEVDERGQVAVGAAVGAGPVVVCTS